LTETIKFPVALSNAFGPSGNEKEIHGILGRELEGFVDEVRVDKLLYEHGLMHLERNKEGDKEKAYSLPNHALDILQKVNAKKRIEKIVAKKILLTA
jgi:hypothetical protein